MLVELKEFLELFEVAFNEVDAKKSNMSDHNLWNSTRYDINSNFQISPLLFLMYIHLNYF